MLGRKGYVQQRKNRSLSMEIVAAPEDLSQNEKKGKEKT